MITEYIKQDDNIKSFIGIKQVHNKLLTLLAIILEFGALVWFVKALISL